MKKGIEGVAEPDFFEDVNGDEAPKPKEEKRILNWDQSVSHSETSDEDLRLQLEKVPSFLESERSIPK